MLRIERNVAVGNGALNGLFAVSWPGHRERDFSVVLRRSLGWVVALEGELLVGFVYVAWDGDGHGFILDVTVRPGFRRRGIGTRLVREAAAMARERGLEWVHVDFEAGLEVFYVKACGFAVSRAGVMRLR